MIESDNRNYGRLVYGFLFRRMPWLALLEDNPVFLREIGRRYTRPPRLALGRPFGWAQNLLYALALSLIVGGALFSYWIWEELAVIALVVLILGAMALSRFYLGGRLKRLTQFSQYLRQEWKEGRLSQLYLTSMSGAGILLGYGAALMFRALWFTVLLIGACLLVAVLSPFARHIDPRFWMKWTDVFYAISIILVLGAQVLLVLIDSTMLTLKSQARQTGAKMTEKIEFGALSSLLAFSRILMIFLPGFAICVFVIMVVNFLAMRNNYEVRRWLDNDWNSMFFQIGLVGIYALVNLPITWLFTRLAVRDFFRSADGSFEEAVVRLTLRDEGSRRSRIFGEK